MIDFWLPDIDGNADVSIDNIHIEFTQIVLKCVGNICFVIDNIILYDVYQFGTISNNMLFKNISKSHVKWFEPVVIQFQIFNTTSIQNSNDEINRLRRE